MSEAALPHAKTGVVARERAAALTTTTTFADLVWAHFQWEASRRASGTAQPELEERYRRTLAEFERAQGSILSAYWSRTDASAVAVTSSPGRFGRADVRFHRVTDWVTHGIPAIPDALDECETLATRAREVLQATSERITIQWIFSVASHLLGLIERSDGAPSEQAARHAAQEARDELDEIERYYRRAGLKAGRIVYAQGMLLGVLVLVVLAFVAAGVLWLFHAYRGDSEGIQTFFACYAAGALGAIVSVMSRMASERTRLSVDYEVGKPALRFLGGLRPILGAIFGLSLYFSVKAGLLQITPKKGNSAFYWYTALSFFAGFSERFTKVLIDTAEKTVDGGEPARAPRPARSPAAKAGQETQDG